MVGEAGDGRSALEIVQRSQPEVLLLDVNMPGMSGVEMVRVLRNLPEASSRAS